MQQSSSHPGELIKTFRHGKALVIFLNIIGAVCLALAGFVLYLRTIAPIQNPPLFYGTAALLVFISLCAFATAIWQKNLRRPSYEVYEKGIAQIIGQQRDYVPFVEIEDLYLFGSGDALFSGVASNLAYRRHASEPFRRITEHLKDSYEFIGLVRELYVRERLPLIVDTLNAGGAATFNYISTGQVWRKRMSGKFLDITTQPIHVSSTSLEVQGHHIPMSHIRDVDLNSWTEKVVIQDASGKTIFSTIGFGILSLDLFLNTLGAILENSQE